MAATPLQRRAQSNAPAAWCWSVLYDGDAETRRVLRAGAESGCTGFLVVRCVAKQVCVQPFTAAGNTIFAAVDVDRKAAAPAADCNPCDT